MDKVLFFYICQKNKLRGDLSPAPAPGCDGSVTNGVGEETKDVSEQ